MNLGGIDEESKVIFGGYDLEKYAKPNATLTWNKLVDDNYWTVSLTEAKLGDYVFDIDVSTAIIDSGTSYIIMP